MVKSNYTSKKKKSKHVLQKFLKYETFFRFLNLPYKLKYNKFCFPWTNNLIFFFLVLNLFIYFKFPISCYKIILLQISIFHSAIRKYCVHLFTSTPPTHTHTLRYVNIIHQNIFPYSEIIHVNFFCIFSEIIKATKQINFDNYNYCENTQLGLVNI